MTKSVSRRAFLSGAAAWATVLLTGCVGSSAAGNPPSTSAAPSKPAASPAASKPAAAASASLAAAGSAQAGAYSPPADWQSQWNSLVDAAKKEGTLVAHFAAGGGPPARTVIPPAFKRAFGIDVQILVEPTAELVSKLQIEMSAGQHTVDVIVSGANTMYGTMYPAKMFQPLRPKIIHPDAANPANWTQGRMWFMDPDQQYILRIANAVSGWVAVNTSKIKPGELTSWKDLLKPQYQGKIASFDPTINGQGAQEAVYLDLKFGDDYVRSLYKGQKVPFTRDNAQFADWLGRGEYPITVSMDSAAFQKLKKDGLPVEVIQPAFSDAPGYETGNTGLIALMVSPPHPNAAQLFCNWMAMAAGQEIYDKAITYVSPLKTVKSDWIPDYQTPKPGVNYLDTYDWDYALKTYPSHFKSVRTILGA